MYHMKRLQEMRRRAEEYVSSIRQAISTYLHINLHASFKVPMKRKFLLHYVKELFKL